MDIPGGGSLPAKKRRVENARLDNNLFGSGEVKVVDLSTAATTTTAAAAALPRTRSTAVDYADDSSSSAGFDSPPSDDDSLDYDDDDDDPSNKPATYVPPDSQDDSIGTNTPLTPHFGTQPPLKQIMSTPPPPIDETLASKRKKRKVSLSPIDNLAQQRNATPTTATWEQHPQQPSPRIPRKNRKNAFMGTNSLEESPPSTAGVTPRRSPRSKNATTTGALEATAARTTSKVLDEEKFLPNGKVNMAMVSTSKPSPPPKKQTKTKKEASVATAVPLICDAPTGKALPGPALPKAAESESATAQSKEIVTETSNKTAKRKKTSPRKTAGAKTTENPEMAGSGNQTRSKETNVKDNKALNTKKKKSAPPEPTTIDQPVKTPQQKPTTKKGGTKANVVKTKDSKIKKPAATKQNKKPTEPKPNVKEGVVEEASKTLPEPKNATSQPGVSGRKNNQPTEDDTPLPAGSESKPNKKPAGKEPKTDKQKKKKRTFQDELLHHMFMTCQPFTAKMLAEHMKSSDAAINFCLLSLVDKQWVVKKEFSSKGGSRTKELFWANQESKAKGLLDTLQMVPVQEIRDARQEWGQLRQQELVLTQELAHVTHEPSNQDLDAQIHASEAMVQELQRRLEETQTRIRAACGAQGAVKPPLGSVQSRGKKQLGGRGRPEQPSSQRSIKLSINTMRGEWKKRKQQCMDFMDQLADGMEKKVKDVVKLLDVETDEAAGVTMPPKYIIDS